MADSPKNEADDDQDRLERHVHAMHAKTELSRRQIFQLMAADRLVALVEDKRAGART